MDLAIEIDLDGAKDIDGDADGLALDEPSAVLMASSYVGGGASLVGPGPSVSCSADASGLDTTGKPF